MGTMLLVSDSLKRRSSAALFAARAAEAERNLFQGQAISAAAKLLSVKGQVAALGESEHADALRALQKASLSMPADHQIEEWAAEAQKVKNKEVESEKHRQSWKSFYKRRYQREAH